MLANHRFYKEFPARRFRSRCANCRSALKYDTIGYPGEARLSFYLTQQVVWGGSFIVRCSNMFGGICRYRVKSRQMYTISIG